MYIFPNPVADYGINDSQQCLNLNNFSFTDLTTINSGNFIHNWLFGDGNSSSLQNPNHTFNRDDTFDVRLFVTSGLNCSDSISKKA